MASTQPWLLVGLGNPGTRYQKTRHNLGFLFLDFLAKKHDATWEADKKHQCIRCVLMLDGVKLHLCKPQTFMNISGDSVQPLAAYYAIPVDQVLVVQDDLDLAFGRLRIKRGGGAGGHKGILSLESRLGSRDFIRFRMGLGDHGVYDPSDYVLANFTAAELSALPALFDRMADALAVLIGSGLTAAMTHFNAEPSHE